MDDGSVDIVDRPVDPRSGHERKVARLSATAVRWLRRTEP